MRSAAGTIGRRPPVCPKCARVCPGGNEGQDRLSDEDCNATSRVQQTDTAQAGPSTSEPQLDDENEDRQETGARYTEP